MSLANRKNSKEFYYKKSYLKKRLQKDVMEDGVAYIPCRVEGIEDIISKFSIKGCESLDSEFQDFVMDFIDFVPGEYPIVLEIHGPKFTEKEKALIVGTIESDMDYTLGKTEEDVNRHKRIFQWVTAGTILSGCILASIRQFLTAVPLEFFYVLFWLFADSLVRYLFIEKFDYEDQKIRAGRLASMKVEFIEDEE
ncbi:MAG: hypothetical protein K6G51_00375 [Sphaerochaetaceae bacterium]|nr:hypothetical protein [Sphaerochaetaceae bacterium]